MSQTTVLHVGGLHWATSEHAIESILSRREGVEAVEANAVNQSATVTYDPDRTSVAELAGLTEAASLVVTGDRTALDAFLATLDTFSLMFPIVTP